MWNVCMGDKAWLAQRVVDSGVVWQIVYTADDNNLMVNNQYSQSRHSCITGACSLTALAYSLLQECFTTLKLDTSTPLTS
jgi:hypothetical protein